MNRIGTYLHIPKTAGTALRNAFVTGSVSTYYNRPFDVARSHSNTLTTTEGIIYFSVRDPLERFCSGYWERYTNPYRKKINDYARSIVVQGSGYKNITPLEQKVFELYKTPNDILTAIRIGDYVKHELSLVDTDLNIMLASLGSWTGTIKEIQENENRIGEVYNIKNLSSIIERKFGIIMPTDPFLKRSRDQFPNIEQSYGISDENKEWFIKDFRHLDYQIIEFIKSKDYYIDN
jgi:hypothetical protein